MRISDWSSDVCSSDLGSLPKPQVREIAKSLDLAVALKPDSQDICFVPDGNYAGIVRKIRPDADEGGAIVHVDGRMLGRHKGLIHYTVGPRKGLEIDRKSGVEGKGASVRVALGGRRIIKKKKHRTDQLADQKAEK